MVNPIEFNYMGVDVTVRLVWAGWEYTFCYNNANYRAHYNHAFVAVIGAKNRIFQLKSTAVIEATSSKLEEK